MAKSGAYKPDNDENKTDSLKNKENVENNEDIEVNFL